jgi:hypothetical protein
MMAGNTQLLDKMRYGRADWGAAGDMLRAGLGNYRVPDLVLDIAMNKRDNQYFQAVRPDADGLEIYASQPEFLITGGGIWAEDHYNKHTILGGPELGAEHAPATATTLMPTLIDATSPDPAVTPGVTLWGGTDRADFIRLAGAFKDENRFNTCVTDGFACGLNPIVPLNYLRRFKTCTPFVDPFSGAGCAPPPPCSIPVNGHFSAKWESLDRENGPLGCPIAPAKDIIDNSTVPPHHKGLYLGASQDFEGGQMVYSPAIGQLGDPPVNRDAPKFVQTAYFDHSNNIVVEWGDTGPWFNYGRFILRAYKDGRFLGQPDIDAGTLDVSRTGGKYTIANIGPGHYSMIIEGCEPHDPFKATCHQAWSNAVEISYPLVNACYAFDGPWTFINASQECGALPGLGYYVAIYEAPCTLSQCNDDNGYQDTYGFFEATSSNGRSFDSFWSTVLAKNGSRNFTPNGVNTYVTADGRTIQFTPIPDPPYMLGVINGEIPDTNPFHIGLASGDIIEADGDGCVVIRNHHLKQSLVLDMRQWWHPTRTFFQTEWASCRS